MSARSFFLMTGIGLLTVALVFTLKTKSPTIIETRKGRTNEALESKTMSTLLWYWWATLDTVRYVGVSQITPEMDTAFAIAASRGQIIAVETDSVLSVYGLAEKFDRGSKPVNPPNGKESKEVNIMVTRTPAPFTHEKITAALHPFDKASFRDVVLSTGLGILLMHFLIAVIAIIRKGGMGTRPANVISGFSRHLRTIRFQIGTALTRREILALGREVGDCPSNPEMAFRKMIERRNAYMEELGHVKKIVDLRETILLETKEVPYPHLKERINGIVSMCDRVISESRGKETLGCLYYQERYGTIEAMYRSYRVAVARSSFAMTVVPSILPTPVKEYLTLSPEEKDMVPVHTDKILTMAEQIATAVGEARWGEATMTYCQYEDVMDACTIAVEKIHEKKSELKKNTMFYEQNRSFYEGNSEFGEVVRRAYVKTYPNPTLAALINDYIRGETSGVPLDTQVRLLGNIRQEVGDNKNPSPHHEPGRRIVRE